MVAGGPVVGGGGAVRLVDRVRTELGHVHDVSAACDRWHALTGVYDAAGTVEERRQVGAEIGDLIERIADLRDVSTGVRWTTAFGDDFRASAAHWRAGEINDE